MTSTTKRVKRNGESIKRRLAKLHDILYKNRKTLFKKQHRGPTKFKFVGSFAVGTGSINPGNKAHFNNGKSGFIRHNFKENTFVFVKPVPEQDRLSEEKKLLYRKAKRILRKFDPEFAKGEFHVQFAYMKPGRGRVDRHKDNDISYQYAISLGTYRGACLRSYSEDEKSFTDLDNHNKIAKFDGRLSHEVITDNFSGKRFTVIFYKNYDRRKTEADPILHKPRLYSLD